MSYLKAKLIFNFYMRNLFLFAYVMISSLVVWGSYPALMLWDIFLNSGTPLTGEQYIQTLYWWPWAFVFYVLSGGPIAMVAMFSAEDAERKMNIGS